MKVVLYGASGMIGSRILRELLSRGHEVTAVVRNTAKLNVPNVTILQGDVLVPERVAETARGADAAISAYSPPADDTQKLVTATKSILKGLKAAGITRFIAVGGAGSLEVSPGVQLVDTPDFPPLWKPYAIAHRDALRVLETADLEWTNLSPAAWVEPGERTGQFRTGTGSLVVDKKGESRISAEDYAVALVDELERPRHTRERFTVAY